MKLCIDCKYCIYRPSMFSNEDLSQCTFESKVSKVDGKTFVKVFYCDLERNYGWLEYLTGFSNGCGKAGKHFEQKEIK